jgi:hypothetical protein
MASLLLLPLAMLVLGATSAGAQTCDRDCLAGMIDRYLEDLVANDPSSLPLADNVRFTEDTVEMDLGQGLWQNATGVRRYRQDILDVGSGTAASQVVVEESGVPVMLMLRMKIEGQEISEIETVVTRSREEGILFNIEALDQTSDVMNRPLSDSEREAREEAIRIANYYPEGLTIGDFVSIDAPFAPDAYREENGGRMAGPGCARGGCENIKTQTIIEHPDLTSEVKAVDEEMGIVLLRMNFGNTGSYGEGNALIVWEAFKVYDGQIHAVEAFMEIMPADAGSGWD